jgi:ribosome recycling factor
VALVVLESPTLAVATCYDPALAKNVCNAIQEKLELNPSIVEDTAGGGGGGATIRIPLPRVSMETRQKTALALKKRAETHRQQIRKQRRTALDIVKQGVAGKLEGISKDDAFRVQKEIETMTDQVIDKLNEITDQKHDSIMAV